MNDNTFLYLIKIMNFIKFKIICSIKHFILNYKKKLKKKWENLILYTYNNIIISINHFKNNNIYNCVYVYDFILFLITLITNNWQIFILFGYNLKYLYY